MPAKLLVPAALMSLAFVFYSAGVWGERIQRNLHGWHVVLFWVGLACDSAGTELMHLLRVAGEEPSLVHTVTGITALGLMAAHAIWATWVFLRGSTDAREGFHRYSLAVWAVWLVPYVGGMVAGIAAGRDSAAAPGYRLAIGTYLLTGATLL